MPVTAKLSKSFYDALGEDVVNELVEWFNQVDATYRGDLREVNEVNFQRFDAKVGERLAELETRIERRMSEGEARLIARFDAKLDQRLSALRDALRGEMKAFHDSLSARMDQLVTKEQHEHLVARVDQLVTKQQFADFRADMADRLGALRGNLLRWMFVSWTGLALVVITANLLR